MQQELLSFLKCPVTKTPLELESIEHFDGNKSGQIKYGLLHSQAGFVFPVIDGVPRMLIESVYDYADFLQKHVRDYAALRKKLEEEYGALLEHCVSKNAKTKESFAFEWSFLNAEKKDKLWLSDLSDLSGVFTNETGKEQAYFQDKIVVDVGCGHGMMTSAISKFSRLAIGVELGKAVEMAYKRNAGENAWYVQGDLQFLPFDNETFDVLYSSGVIHHTNDTELSLSLIEPVLRPGGRICLWLYHPQEKVLHHLSIFLRKILNKPPLKVSFLFIMLFIFPITFLYKKIRGKRVNYREEIILLLDAFTPQYRYEIPAGLASVWLKRRKYKEIAVTTTDQFGFSIAADK